MRTTPATLFVMALCATACGKGVDESLLACADETLGSRTGSPVAEGTLQGVEGVDTANLDSASLATSRPEVHFAWQAPRRGAFRITTLGSNFDTVLTVNDGCGGTQLLFNDDAGSDLHSELTLEAPGRESYLLTILGYTWADYGDYVLNIEGE